jgi:hypothetical protein
VTETLPPLEVVWAPTPDQVAQLLRARTKDSAGKEVGAWTADTRPTLVEVEGIIELAVGQLSAAIGAAVPDVCAQGAQGAAALLAAMLVELSYFPEQVRSDRSAYAEYKALYDGRVVMLQDCVESAGGDGGAAGAGTGFGTMPVRPAYPAAPPAEVGLVGVAGPWGDLPGDHWPEPENPANWADPFQPPRQPPQPGDLPVGDQPASGEVLP